ncbi:hypothetical protein IGK47_000052 [Enterococcus sp. AZ007]
MIITVRILDGKHSGFGRENGMYGVEEYVDVKFINIRTAK